METTDATVGTATDVDFHSCDGSVCSFTVTIPTSDAVVSAYSGCAGQFVVPGNPPDFDDQSCSMVRSKVCSANDNQTVCRFGPFMLAPGEHGWWVATQTPTWSTTNYVALIPEAE